MTNPIVTVNVSQRSAPTPSKLQKSGAFVSQGATVTSVGTKSLLTQLSDLTPLLKGALAISGITWLGSVATVTTASPHGFTVDDVLPLTIAGAVPAGYNGTFDCTITGASTFTYALASDPGSETTPGVYTPEDVAELVAMATTFFAQGRQQAVWVLELGAGGASDGVAALTAWITANPNTFYSYLVPRFWDANSNFLTMLGNFNALDAKTYFFITTTLATWQNYKSTMKCALTLIEAPVYGKWPANVLTAASYAGGQVTATTTTNHGVSVGDYFTISGCTPAGYNGTFKALPGTATNTLVYAVASDPGAESVLGTLVASQYASTGIPATEFSMAAQFFVTLNYAPSSTNRVTPLNLAFVYGVTAFPSQGNAALLATLDNASVGIIGTGAEGGLTNTIIIGGNTMDGNPFKYWYSVDWAQVTIDTNVTAYLIDGANNPANPVDYNQAGINGLQQVAVDTMNNGISYGLVLNPVKPTTLSAQAFQTALDAGAFDGYTAVNADPFASYGAENPDDYKAGVYNGISIDYVPLRGFESITFNVTVSDFATG